MMKRFMSLCVVLCLLAPSITAYADVVMGNDFFDKNEGEVKSLDRTVFVVNGPDGYVIPQEKPGEAKKTYKYEWNKDSEEEELPKYENGTILPLKATYIKNQEHWGIMCSGHYTFFPGWIPMKHLLAVYTPDDFSKENEEKIYTYSGNSDSLTKAERLVLWQWPGSDREKRVLDSSSSMIKGVKVIKAYKDTEGREWGYINMESNTYIYPSDGWVCLTEPANSSIPPFYPAPKPSKWSPDGNLKWEHVDANVKDYEQNLLSNITKIKTYDTPFIDVPNNVWYQDAVKSAYEYGIIVGKEDGKFDPDGSLTVREAIIIAARIHAYYKYGKEEGTRWLDVYNNEYYGPRYIGAEVRYCEAEGIIKADEFEDVLYSPITRAQMVHVWSKILASKDMTKRNTVIKLPDVNKDTDYSADIFLFYEAGIVGGVDTKGSFHPDGNITRAQAATIFMNLIDVNKRYSGKTYGIAH